MAKQTGRLGSALFRKKLSIKNALKTCPQPNVILDKHDKDTKALINE